MLLQHKGNITGKLAFKPEEEIGGTSKLVSRRVVGWSMSATITTQFFTDALTMAI